jgi:DNA-directed RNA polymerase III subunit RPC1
VSSPDRIVGRSVVEVSCPLLFDTQSKPAANGPLDVRLGRSKDDGLCGTCNLGVLQCSGHFGHVPLELPLFHAGYFKQVMLILRFVPQTVSFVLSDG